MAETGATVRRMPGGWEGTTSTGRDAYLRDGNVWWFSRDFGAQGALTRAEQNELDAAAMAAIREGSG